MRAAFRSLQAHLLHPRPARHRHANALEHVHHGQKLFRGLQAVGELHRSEQHRVHRQLYALRWVRIASSERHLQLGQHLR